MAAVMNCDIHLTDKLGAYKQEVDRLGIEVVPPCVNRSAPTFTVADGRIVYALGALKNVGVEAMRLITEARAAGGRFAGLFDFAARVDLRRLGKRALEMLARSGALDALDSNRRKVFESLESLMAYSAAAHDERASAQVSLFGEATDALPAPRLPQPDDWSPMERLAQEHQAIGFYLSGHPLDDYAAALRRERVLTYAELLRKAAGASATIARVAGTVAAVDQRKSARGTRFAFVSPFRPDRALRGADVLRRARRRPRPPRARTQRGADRRGRAGRRRAAADSPAPRSRSTWRSPARPAPAFRIFLNDAAAAASLRTRLDAVARDVRSPRTGPIEIVPVAPDLACEPIICLKDEYPLTPQVRAALIDVPGVLDVVDV